MCSGGLSGRQIGMGGTHLVKGAIRGHAGQRGVSAQCGGKGEIAGGGDGGKVLIPCDLADPGEGDEGSLLHVACLSDPAAPEVGIGPKV